MVPQKYLLLVSISGMIVSLDQLTKFLILMRLKTGESLAVIQDFFHITFVQNPGMAFGLFSNLNDTSKDLIFLVGPSLILCGIIYVFTKTRENQLATIYGYCFIVGGALGNLLDRVRSGYVVDFMDIRFFGRWHFPAFNIADCSITFGIILLILGIFADRESRIE